MKNSQRSRSGKFARYTVASTAALGAAAAAKAQFTGSYDYNTGAPGTFTNGATNAAFGNWTGTKAGTSNAGTGWNLTTVGDGTSLVLGAATSFSTLETPSLTFLSTAAASGNVSFTLSSSASPTGGHDFFYTADGSTYNLITSSTYTGGFSFAVTNGATFGFRVAAAYLSPGQPGSMQVTLTNFSAPTAIPEPGASGLLTGCAALGFVALTGVREMRRRAANKAA